MGLDVSGEILVGFSVSVYESTKDVTYYDKHTGKPYIEKETYEYWASETGLEIDAKDDYGNEIFNNYEESVGVFGVRVGKCTNLRNDKNAHIRQINLEKLTEAIEKMKRIYPKENIQVSNFMCISY